ncbi:MAG: primosomal protein N' [Rickettsiales bacterium]|jgi:primosomal protein N' (replication factor Y)|nr:primosomal protein N' [Rickettsiales bacterium]
MKFNCGDIVKVLVPNVVNSGYDYRLRESAMVGQFAGVNVGPLKFVGVIVGPGDSGLPAEKIKSAMPIANYRLPAAAIAWIYKMADWTMMAPGAVLRLIVNVPEVFAPPKMEILYSFAGGGKITAARMAIADAFDSNDNSPMTAADLRNIARVSPSVINTMIKNGGLVRCDEKIKKHKSEIINYFDTGSVVLNAEQQAAAEEIVNPVNHPAAARHPSKGGELRPNANASSPPLEGCPQGGVVYKYFQTFLLDGITGSGKTQVYFDAALRAYLNGGNVLIMLPEIALTAQFINRFRDRFGAPPVVWHSNLTAANRRDIWRGVAGGEIKIVIGTRSALFLPWQKLDLIVVDEEHDGSYKQEDQGIYNARDMAVLRAKIEDCPIVLASATPSFETLKNAASGRYRHLRLTARFGGAVLPRIEIVDLRVKSR